MTKEEVEDVLIRAEIEAEMRAKAKRQADDRLRKEAEELIKAADAGDLESQIKVANNYIEGGRYFPQNITKSFHYALLAAEQGHLGAQYSIAVCYFKGIGVEKDFVKAFEWFQRAAEQENGDSIAYLGGFFYLYGIGTEVDLLQAAKCLQKALDLGVTNDWTKQRSNETINMLREEISSTEHALDNLLELPNHTSLFSEGEITITPCFRIKKETADALEQTLQKC